MTTPQVLDHERGTNAAVLGKGDRLPLPLAVCAVEGLS
jgi:hypothetical protein